MYIRCSFLCLFVTLEADEPSSFSECRMVAQGLLVYNSNGITLTSWPVHVS